MKFLLTTTILFLASICFGQNFIDRHFGDYEDLDESTVIHVTSKSFELASFVLPENDDETRDIKEFVASVKAFDLIGVPGLSNAKDEYKRGLSILDNGFEELMNIKEKSSRFSLFIDEENDVVYEVVGIGIDEDAELFVFSVTGEMDLEMIGSILNKIESEELVSFKKVKSYDAAAFNIYPNPVSSQTELNIDIPTSMNGGTGTLLDMSGASISSFDIRELSHQINTSNLTPGTYILNLEKDGVNLKKQVVIVK